MGPYSTPEIIRDLSKDDHCLYMTDAWATADRFSLKNRGYLRDGYSADITVFHEGELKSATPDQQKSFGIKKVFINGNLVLEDGNVDVTLLKNAGRAVRNNAEAEG
ncbi:MAG TPA: hypothetical protein PKA19_16200 [Bacillota bacterium]|nr:hypothetical protein [Bacillota bacterium]